MGKILGRIDLKKKDQSFREFLDTLPDVAPDLKQLATDFVEGFDAARTERISTHALAKDEEASERSEADQSFRISNGAIARLIR